MPGVDYWYFRQSPNDPDRFLVMTQLNLNSGNVNTAMTVIENWFKEFDRK